MELEPSELYQCIHGGLKLVASVLLCFRLAVRVDNDMIVISIDQAETFVVNTHASPSLIPIQL